MEIKLKRISRGKQTIKKSFLAQKNISQKELKIKKVFRYTKHYLKLLTEGRNIKDKIGILLFLPNTFKFLFSYSAYRDFLWSISIKNERGVFFCGKNHVTVHTASSFNEYKIKNYFKLSKGTFIDIGANIGIYSIELGRELDKNGNVISIEADPTTFNFLLENIRLNNLENILPLNVGCFSADKKMPFFVEKTGGAYTHFIKKATTRKKF
ncbi:MAG: FkbM family methyltransferase [Nanoarchaeota archaeon]|nr:FkbM family methyltransferase [Nanoarchaeota archaeon]